MQAVDYVVKYGILENSLTKLFVSVSFTKADSFVAFLEAKTCLLL